MCSYTKDTKCTKTSVTNSIVGGCPYAGFIAVGYGCADPAGGSTTNVFKDNVAHSVDGSGACIFPDPGLSSGKTCYQGSDFKAYKNSQASIGVMQETNEARFSTIISVDNTLGVSINLSGETDVEKKAVFKNSFVYGESSDLAKDCPDGSGSATGADCYCQDKMGHMSTLNPRNDKPPHNPSASARPVYKQKSYSTWNAKAIIENVQFINFKSD